tara:strand:- start:308 stop:784 length:477 start_codon:yes stop_codon:yes gene_type:complete
MMAYKRKKGKNIVTRGGKKKDFSFKGIAYKSGLEKNMAMLLDSAGIEFEYEAKTFEVVESFKFDFDCYERQANGKGEMINRGRKKVQGIKYTPDFIGEGFIIETKGYANESFPIRWKLFKRMLFEQTANDIHKVPLTIYKPQTVSECEEVIKLIKERR